MASYWVSEVQLDTSLELPSGERSGRDGFFAWAWNQLTDLGLQGVHEGTILCEEAAEVGLETESWLVDSGEAPRNRDWIGSQAQEVAQFYFGSLEQAEQAAQLFAQVQGCRVLRVFEEPVQDWDAEWKKSFRGIDIDPDWRVVPPWEEVSASPSQARHRILVNPGAGFGTGTHETTQLCLEGFSSALQKGLQLGQVLDFGSGSGILAISAAIRGSKNVHAIEIDPLAIENAQENARLNRVQDCIQFGVDFESLEGAAAPIEGYSLIFANILKPVLLEFAVDLTQRLSSGGVLVLSGLIESDVPAVVSRYQGLLSGVAPEILARNEWRALVFKKP